MKDNDNTGYPIIMSKESQLLLGYILKKDLKMALGLIHIIILHTFYFEISIFSLKRTIQRIRNDK